MRAPLYSGVSARFFRFALSPRFSRPAASLGALDPCDPHVLAVALLHRWGLRRAAPAGAPPPLLEKSELMREMALLWGGGTRHLPASSRAFIPLFPALFAHSGGSGDKHNSPGGVRLTAAAAARLRTAGAPGGPRVEALLAAGCWPPRAVALLRATPLEWLPPPVRGAPDPAAFGPLVERTLARAGGELPMGVLLRAVQEAALEAGLPLPVLSHAAHQFVFSPHPAYARLRPLHRSEPGGRDGGQVTRFLVALTKGPSLDEDVEELRALAEAVRGREAAEAAARGGGLVTPT